MGALFWMSHRSSTLAADSTFGQSMGLTHEAMNKLRQLFVEVSRDKPAVMHLGDQMAAVLRQSLRRFELDADDEDVLAAMFVTAMFTKTLRNNPGGEALLRATGDPETAVLFALAATVRQRDGDPRSTDSSEASGHPRELRARFRGLDRSIGQVRRGGPRLVEVPGLEDVGEHLTALGVDDVRIHPVALAGRETAWLPVVFLGRPPGGHPWALGLRPSHEDAQRAVETLLRGLAEGRARGIDQHPYILDRDPEAMARRHEAALEATQQWASSSGSYHTALRYWGNRLRTARERQGWTRQEFADRLEVRHHDVAQFERGLQHPDPETLAQIMMLLDVPDPPPGDGGAGA